MKYIKALSLAALLLAASCSNYSGPGEKSSTEPTRADVGYAFGVAVGKSLKSAGVDIDQNVFMSAINDQLKNTSKMDIEQANSIIQAAMNVAQVKMGEDNKKKGAEFMASNGKKEGIVTTSSGLQYEVLTAAEGPKPAETDEVTVHYTGFLLDGTEFDSSVKRNMPATFMLNEVIPGWTEAVQLMSQGAKYKFYIPAELGYGEMGAGNTIPPNATLIFEVELLSFGPHTEDHTHP